MKTLKQMLGIGAAAMVATLVTVAPASAANNTVQNHKMQYCYTLIRKIHPPQPASRVVSRKCSFRHMPGSMLPLGVTPDRSEARLVIFYENKDFNEFAAGLNNEVYGDNGPCDATGYGLSDLRIENGKVNGISS